MLVAHWLYLVAAGVELLISKPEEGVEDAAGGPSQQSNWQSNVHVRGILATSTTKETKS